MVAYYDMRTRHPGSRNLRQVDPKVLLWQDIKEVLRWSAVVIAIITLGIFIFF